MLELPEAIVISAQLKKELLGQKILRVDANASPHKFAWFYDNPNLYEDRLSGQVVTDVRPRSGQVEIHLDKMRLTLSDGVNIRLYSKGDKLPAKHQLMIDFENDKILVFSVQMYGGLMAFEDGENQNPYYLVAGLKPSPLSEAFDQDYFEKMLSSEKQTLSLKAFLATEQRIPGLGNGVLQDILYNAGLHPKLKIGVLSTEQKNALFKSLKSTLSEMSTLGGRDTEKDLYGNVCGYPTRLSSLTQNEPCHRCGDIIHKESYMGGSIYFCATCQPM